MNYSQFEISLFSEKSISLEMFQYKELSYFDTSIIDSRYANVLLFEFSDFNEYFVTVNNHELFKEDFLFEDIKKFLENVTKLFKIIQFDFGIANFETNSFFTEELKSINPTNRMIEKSLFIFFDQKFFSTNYIKEKHIIFKNDSLVLLFNPCI